MPRGRKVIDRTGDRYGRLLVLRRVQVEGKTRPRWLCLCDCGTEVVVTSDHLGQGTRSCGCLQRTHLVKGHVSYGSAHVRVSKARGAAREYDCVDCGGAAEHWSYDHADPDEVTGPSASGRLVPYSLKVDHYEPRCATCHRRFDRQVTV